MDKVHPICTLQNMESVLFFLFCFDDVWSYLDGFIRWDVLGEKLVQDINVWKRKRLERNFHGKESNKEIKQTNVNRILRKDLRFRQWMSETNKMERIVLR